MIRRKSIIHLQQLVRLTVSARGALFPEYSKEYSCAKSSSFQTRASRGKKHCSIGHQSGILSRGHSRERTMRIPMRFRTIFARYLDEESFRNFILSFLFFSFCDWNILSPLEIRIHTIVHFGDEAMGKIYWSKSRIKLFPYLDNLLFETNNNCKVDMREMSIDCNNELYSKFLTNNNTFSTCFNAR